MTQNDWEMTEDLPGMLLAMQDRFRTGIRGWFISTPEWRYMQRKLRLLLCACYEVENEGFGLKLAHAIELVVARQYVDGLASSYDLARARVHVAREMSSWPSDLVPPDWFLAECFVQPKIRVHDAIVLLGSGSGMVGCSPRRTVSSIIRDVIYNPFAGPLVDTFPFPSAQETVRDLAASIYHNRLFSDMPILGDALLEAGYTNPRILDHCRSVEPHYPGCWLLDLLLREDCAEVLTRR